MNTELEMAHLFGLRDSARAKESTHLLKLVSLQHIIHRICIIYLHNVLKYVTKCTMSNIFDLRIQNHDHVLSLLCKKMCVLSRWLPRRGWPKSRAECPTWAWTRGPGGLGTSLQEHHWPAIPRKLSRFMQPRIPQFFRVFLGKRNSSTLLVCEN